MKKNLKKKNKKIQALRKKQLHQKIIQRNIQKIRKKQFQKMKRRHEIQLQHQLDLERRELEMKKQDLLRHQQIFDQKEKDLKNIEKKQDMYEKKVLQQQQRKRNHIPHRKKMKKRIQENSQILQKNLSTPSPPPPPQPTYSLTLNPQFSFFPPQPARPKNVQTGVQIYGPFNTGTNLLTKFLQAIFHIQILRDGSSHDWKHALDIPHRPNLFNIFIIKNPFSWFQSMFKEPYDVKLNRKKRLLFQPIHFYRKHVPVGKKYNVKFQSLPKLWFHYYSLYLQYAQKHNNCIFITYEDLLYNTDSVMNQLSSLFGIPLPPQYQTIKEKTFQKPAKKKGKCNNFQKAVSVNQIDYLFSKYSKEDTEKFIRDIPIPHILDYHKNIWKINEWIQHFIFPQNSTQPTIIEDLPSSNNEISDDELNNDTLDEDNEDDDDNYEDIDDDEEIETSYVS